MRALARIVPFAPFLFACEALAPRIAPVQSARFVQTESFSQTFRVRSVPHAERVFLRILGPKNYEALSAAEWAPHMQKLVSGNVRAFGNATLVIGVYPLDLSKVYLEGWGSYRAVDTSTDEILVSGTFEIASPLRSMEELKGGSLPLTLRQTVQRHFGLDKPNYVNVTDVAINTHIRQIDEDLYTIDYERGHEVGIRSASGKFEVLGCLEFGRQGDGRKLIDLRGLSLIRDDYREKTDAKGFSTPKPAPMPAWIELQKCSLGDKSSHCECGPAAKSG